MTLVNNHIPSHHVSEVFYGYCGKLESFSSPHMQGKDHGSWGDRIGPPRLFSSQSKVSPPFGLAKGGLNMLCAPKPKVIY